MNIKWRLRTSGDIPTVPHTLPLHGNFSCYTEMRFETVWSHVELHERWRPIYNEGRQKERTERNEVTMELTQREHEYKTREAMYVWCNIEARLGNHRCSITYSACVVVALVIQNAMRMRHIVICGLLCGSTTFFHIIS